MRSSEECILPCVDWIEQSKPIRRTDINVDVRHHRHVEDLRNRFSKHPNLKFKRGGYRMIVLVLVVYILRARQNVAVRQRGRCIEGEVGHRALCASTASILFLAAGVAHIHQAASKRRRRKRRGTALSLTAEWAEHSKSSQMQLTVPPKV